MKVILLPLLAGWWLAAAVADLPPQPVEVSQDRDTAGEETMLTTEILFGLNEMFREEEERREKSLLNSFPFNQAKGHHGDHASHDTHGEYHGHGEHGVHHGEDGEHHVHGEQGEHHGHGEHGEHHEHGDHEGHEEYIDHERHPHTDVGVATSPLRQDLSNRNSGLG